MKLELLPTQYKKSHSKRFNWKKHLSNEARGKIKEKKHTRKQSKFADTQKLLEQM